MSAVVLPDAFDATMMDYDMSTGSINLGGLSNSNAIPHQHNQDMSWTLDSAMGSDDPSPHQQNINTDVEIDMEPDMLAEYEMAGDVDGDFDVDLIGAGAMDGSEAIDIELAEDPSEDAIHIDYDGSLSVPLSITTMDSVVSFGSVDPSVVPGPAETISLLTTPSFEAPPFASPFFAAQAPSLSIPFPIPPVDSAALFTPLPLSASASGSGGASAFPFATSTVSTTAPVALSPAPPADSTLAATEGLIQHDVDPLTTTATSIVTAAPPEALLTPSLSHFDSYSMFPTSADITGVAEEPKKLTARDENEEPGFAPAQVEGEYSSEAGPAFGHEASLDQNNVSELEGERGLEAQAPEAEPQLEGVPDPETQPEHVPLISTEFMQEPEHGPEHEREGEGELQVEAEAEETAEDGDDGTDSSDDILPSVLLSFSPGLSELECTLFTSIAPAREHSQTNPSSDLTSLIVLPLLLADRTHLFYEPVAHLFEALRLEEPVMHLEHAAQGGMTLEAYDIDLAIAEDNVYAREVTLHDLALLHVGCGLVGPLRVRLGLAPMRFITRYQQLRDHVARMSLVGEDGEVEFQAEAKGQEEGQEVAEAAVQEEMVEDEAAEHADMDDNTVQPPLDAEVDDGADARLPIEEGANDGDGDGGDFSGEAPVSNEDAKYDDEPHGDDVDIDANADANQNEANFPDDDDTNDDFVLETTNNISDIEFHQVPGGIVTATALEGEDDYPEVLYEPNDEGTGDPAEPTELDADGAHETVIEPQEGVEFEHVSRVGEDAAEDQVEEELEGDDGLVHTDGNEVGSQATEYEDVAGYYEDEEEGVEGLEGDGDEPGFYDEAGLDLQVGEDAGVDVEGLGEVEAEADVEVIVDGDVAEDERNEEEEEENVEVYEGDEGTGVDADTGAGEGEEESENFNTGSFTSGELTDYAGVLDLQKHDNVQEENVGNEPSASSQPTHPKAGVSTEGATVDTLEATTYDELAALEPEDLEDGEENENDNDNDHTNSSHTLDDEDEYGAQEELDFAAFDVPETEDQTQESETGSDHDQKAGPLSRATTSSSISGISKRGFDEIDEGDESLEVAGSPGLKRARAV